MVRLFFSSTYIMYNDVVLEPKSFRSKKYIFVKYLLLQFIGSCKFLHFRLPTHEHDIYFLYFTL